MAERPTGNRRLRKQPKLRRVQSATAVGRPGLQIPATARQRQRRNQRRINLPTAGIKQFVFSARWVSLALLAICVYALYLTGMDEHFYLMVIPVEGTVSIAPAELVAASGLGGIHVFAADPNQAAADIAQVPGVLAATVTLKWPNQVAIQIQEESPIAVWVEGSNQYWVMNNGRLIPARSQTLGLLIIESEIMPGTEPAMALTAVSNSDEPAIIQSAEAAFVPQEVLQGALQLQQLRPNIDRLYYRPSSGLSYQDGRGWRVYFGSGADMHQKLVVYETIVDDLLARGLTPAYVSVSNQKKPYYLAR